MYPRACDGGCARARRARQALYLRDVPLDDDERLVSAAGVVPGARVFCAAGSAHNPDDIADVLDDGKGGAPERGFAGTRLLGGSSGTALDADGGGDAMVVDVTG